MSKEYSIEVRLNPTSDEKPYFWCLFHGHCTYGCGWASTPDEAWKDAYSYYNKFYNFNKV